MDEHEAAAVRQERTNMEQMDKLIQLLLGKSDEDFATFLRMLRATNNGTWACQLEERAEQFSQREPGVFGEEWASQTAVHSVNMCDDIFGLHVMLDSTAV